MWALVTGGAKRLGAAICLELAEQGHCVAIHYRRSCDEAQEVAEACRSYGVKADVIQGDFSTVEGVKKFSTDYIAQFPETSVLINNVGDYLVNSALETSVENWMHQFQLNLHAPLILSQALSQSLIKHKGQILNIGVSGLQRQCAYVHATAYSLAKQALWGLTLSLARELASKDVRVNMVSPGELDLSVEQRKIPMHRPARCDEVCRVITFLLDSSSSYITGQNIEVAGGLGLT